MGGIERVQSLSNATQYASDKEGKKGSILLQYLKELISHTMQVRGFAVLTLRDKAKHSSWVKKILPNWFCIGHLEHYQGVYSGR